MTMDDQYNLARFLKAQAHIYDNVVSELKGGRKYSHWMWFIFPQIDGLGYSQTARFYAIKSTAEARDYLQHPLLGARLKECTQLVLDIKDSSLAQVFGYPDDRKFKSSMTLFASVSEAGSIFVRALEQFCGGQQDDKTLAILQQQSSSQ